MSRGGRSVRRRSSDIYVCFGSKFVSGQGRDARRPVRRPQKTLLPLSHQLREKDQRTFWKNEKHPIVPDFSGKNYIPQVWKLVCAIFNVEISNVFVLTFNCLSQRDLTYLTGMLGIINLCPLDNPIKWSLGVVSTEVVVTRRLVTSFRVLDLRLSHDIFRIASWTHAMFVLTLGNKYRTKCAVFT